jgi:hypothetical protein
VSIELILVALAPAIVAGLTQLVKKISLSKLLTSDFRKVFFRFIAAALSFVVVIIMAALSGTEVDPIAIETFAKAIEVFLGATGAYLLMKSKKEV